MGSNRHCSLGSILASKRTPTSPATVLVVVREPSDDDLAAPEADDSATVSVGQLLDQLPERYRQAVVLFYMEDKSYEQTATSLGLPLGTVKALLHRARKRLIELTKEAEASAAASYSAPAPDGSRPGVFQIPLRPEYMNRLRRILDRADELGEVENEDTAHALVQFDDGVMGTLVTSRAHWGRKSHLGRDGIRSGRVRPGCRVDSHRVRA